MRKTRWRIALGALVLSTFFACGSGPTRRGAGAPGCAPTTSEVLAAIEKIARLPALSPEAVSEAGRVKLVVRDDGTHGGTDADNRLRFVLVSAGERKRVEIALVDPCPVRSEDLVRLVKTFGEYDFTRPRPVTKDHEPLTIYTFSTPKGSLALFVHDRAEGQSLYRAEVTVFGPR